MFHYWVITAFKARDFLSWSMAKAYILSQPYPVKVEVKKEVEDWAGDVDFVKVGVPGGLIQAPYVP